jgi:membrane-associated protease RseP (regulator of RpoE activity)
MLEQSPANPKRRWSRPLLFVLALVFAVATILYTTLWMLAKRWATEVELGFDNSPSLVVTDVYKNSPAEKAGLLPGDQILAIDGTRLKGATSLYQLYKAHQPGDMVRLTVARPSQTPQSSSRRCSAAGPPSLSRPAGPGTSPNYCAIPILCPSS